MKRNIGKQIFGKSQITNDDIILIKRVLTVF